MPKVQEIEGFKRILRVMCFFEPDLRKDRNVKRWLGGKPATSTKFSDLILGTAAGSKFEKYEILNGWPTFKQAAVEKLGKSASFIEKQSKEKLEDEKN